MKHSYFILTDSGNVHEETPGLVKPVLVMQDTTERLEAVSAATVQFVGANKENIINVVQSLIDGKAHYTKMSKAHNLYGNGIAVEEIIMFINININKKKC